MDLSLARTFLEIVSSRSFVQAARHLHVTQTAVSARVRTLEDLVGRQLFVRNKAGASLTPAGEQFVRHAQALVQVWERARHQMAVPEGCRALVAVGCETSLWDPLLPDWLQWLRRHDPSLAVSTEVGEAANLLERVADGALDVVIAYAPRQWPGLRVELLMDERLVLVTTAADGHMPEASEYVYVDWGADFSARHSLAFPQLSSVRVSSNLGPLAVRHVLASGGAAYFRESVVRELVKAGQLYRVPGAPEFPYPAYAVHAEDADPGLIAPVLAGLRHAVRRSPSAARDRPAAARRRSPRAS